MAGTRVGGRGRKDPTDVSRKKGTQDKNTERKDKQHRLNPGSRFPIPPAPGPLSPTPSPEAPPHAALTQEGHELLPDHGLEP